MSSPFTWDRDSAGLPVVQCEHVGRLAVDAPYSHLIGSGRISAMCDQWGNVELITTEGGFLRLSPNSPRCVSGAYALLSIGEATTSLHPINLDRTTIRYGIGFASYAGSTTIERHVINVEHRYYVLPDCAARFHYELVIWANTPDDLPARVTLRSDFFPMPQFSFYDDIERIEEFRGEPGFATFPVLVEQTGSVFVIGPQDAEPQRDDFSLELSVNRAIRGGEGVVVKGVVGYGEVSDVGLERRDAEATTFEDAHGAWQQRVAALDSVLGARCTDSTSGTVAREAAWSYGQFLSFRSYDSSVGEHYFSLGGYCWKLTSSRENCEHLLLLSHVDHDLATATVRWLAKQQLRSGDIPNNHDFKRDKFMWGVTESDLEIWFVLGVCDVVTRTKQIPFLYTQLPYWDGGVGTLWEHLVRAYHWITKEIGFGSHGLIRIRDGDWNDYLSGIGRDGNGESTMNSGMACRAFSLLADLAELLDEAPFAAEVRERVDRLREAVAGAFDRKWFVRGYTDEGFAVGSHDEGMLFLNAQTWAILGGCGTPRQRETAATSALEHCDTRIGLSLMSRPYPSPPPPWISRCPIPPGEGENAGIWPQTVHWFLWALAELGFVDEAREQWDRVSLDNHHRRFPDVPFGIFNGPDCYSSTHAGMREGWTQKLVWDRTTSTPMSPSVAWQVLSLIKMGSV